MVMAVIVQRESELKELLGCVIYFIFFLMKIELQLVGYSTQVQA